jgi:hypothetical protein
MAKHIIGIDKSLLFDPTGEVDVRHIFLLRDPLENILSWGVKNAVHQEEFTLESSGLPYMVSLFSEIRVLTGVVPIVFDSSTVKAHPKEIIYELCQKLDIPYYEEQLTWPSGPKSIDGLWGSYWYDQVHKSTGFGKGLDTRTYPVINKDRLEMYRESLPFYNVLRSHAIGIDYLNPGSFQPPLHLGSYDCYANSEITGVDQVMKMRLNTFSSKVFEGTRVTSGIPLSDARNKDVLIWVGNHLYPREQAKISVFDSAVQGGDAVWEGLRVYKGKIFKLHEHLNRLQDSGNNILYLF